MSASTTLLAVCSWSLQPTGPRDLITKLEATGIARVQLALDPLLESPGIWEKSALCGSGVEIVSGMFGCAGEDYSTLESIRLTGGVAPDATWEQNLAHIRASSELAADLGLELVTFHAGFLPHDQSDPAFGKMIGRLKKVAEIFSDAGIPLAMETGQETADSLALLLQNLPGVGVNFDPANMILYGMGDPVTAIHTLGPWIRQVHIKDAIRTKVPGTWGEEVAVGSGEVDWPGFFRALDEVNFTGNYVIEREAGTQRIADILTARELVLNH